MINKETFKFLKDLSENNNKPWMTENRERYEVVRGGLIEFTQILIDEFAEIEPRISMLNPKNV